MLEQLRVVDLTDERGLLCGRLLADLGADVVQVEPLDGSPARSAPPVVANGLRSSMVWETFAAGKRAVALDLDGEAGLSVLRRLAAQADVFVTSLPAPWLRERGLDPDALRAVAPRLVYTVISGFGWSGPKAAYADSDLVVWAAGGPLDPHRDDSGLPLRISVPQAFLHASADAAAGALLAVLARQTTGRGQVVDVSAQASLGVATLSRVLAHAVGDAHPEWHPQPVAHTERPVAQMERPLAHTEQPVAQMERPVAHTEQPVARTDQSGSGAATPNRLKKWQCRDGMVELHLSMGPASGGFTNNLFGWLRAEGAIDESIADWDWRVLPDRIASGEVTAGDLEESRAAVRAFLLTKTKAEVLDAAMKHRLLCMAIFDTGDICASPHLEQRGFWASVDIDGHPTRVPGRIAQVTGGDGPRVRRRAPRIGEHTEEVQREWLGSGDPHRAGGAGEDGAVTKALEGLKVLDLSWVVAGPLIGRALADFGAQVVRVESSTRVETARLMQPFYGGVQDKENSALFGNCNAGKLGLTVDLRSAEGQTVVKDLAGWADVVLESFSPGQLAKWGLDYATLCADKPSLIMLSTSIAGQTGPWAMLAGYGNVGSSLSGFQDLVGFPDDVPLGPFGPYTDYVGPRLALVTLLAAIESRRRTGQGRYIDVAQVEAGVFFLSPQIAHYGVDRTIARRRGNRDEVLAPHGVYRCLAEDGRDRFVAVAVRTDDEWRRLAGAMGRQDLADRGDLGTAAGRRRAADELDQAIATWTVTRRAVDVEQRLQSAGVPAHLSAASADFVTDPQLVERGHIVSLDHPRHGTAYVEGPRYLLSDTPGEVVRPAPTLGQHTEVVLRDILGYSEERIDELRQGGVLR